jgi:hypothetical protein
MFIIKEKVEMKRSLLTAIMLLAVGVAFADNMYKEGTIVIPPNSTTSTVAVTFGRGEDFGFIDRVVAYNPNVDSTGSVAFAAFDLGAKPSANIAVSGNLDPGASWGLVPRFAYDGATVTNAEYSVKRMLITVIQTVTNVAPQTYKWGVYTK